uniref:Putative ACP n=1 Tax=Actinomyces sp. Lu 9419 TaxID=416175 RepID=B5SP94_9ACTO|nr:putative ACP [Actinomyces sp. Lu 9419]
MSVMLEPEDVGLDASFTELGIDSLSRLELVALVEQHVGVLVPEDQIPALDSINEVTKFAESLTAA